MTYINHDDYIWNEALKVALKYFKEEGITKASIPKTKDTYRDMFYQYGDDIREECVNQINIPKFVRNFNLSEIEEFYGDVKDYAESFGFNDKKHIDILVNDWSWDMNNNPNCVLASPFFWEEVYKKLPSGKMAGHRTRAPSKKSCSIKVNFRGMI